MGQAPGSGAPAAGPGAALLLVGNVDYGARPGSADARGTSRAAAADARARSFAVFGRLAATGGEITALRDLFQRRYPTAPVLDLRGAQATEGTIREQAGHHRWIHLATHGFFAPPTLRSALTPEPAGAAGPARPVQRAIDPFGGRGVVGFHPGLLSGVALTGANRPPEPGQDDGILTATEVAELDLSGVELVALSACETGLGESAGGEGVLGLQRAFQEAGVGSVVASLWSVDDAATRAMMERFYQDLWQEGLGKLAALRERSSGCCAGGRRGGTRGWWSGPGVEAEGRGPGLSSGLGAASGAG